MFTNCLLRLSRKAICWFIAQFKTQTHEESAKIRIRNFKPTVLEAYLEFANETGTVGKLCISTFTLYNLFCVSNKFSVRNSKKTTEVQLEECKVTGADQFSEQ